MLLLMSSRSAMLRLLLLVTLTVGGAVTAIGVGMPIPLLTGPAIVTTIASVSGIDLQFPMRVRDVIFLFAGIAIGATISPESIAALTRWPFAFAILAISVLVMILVGQRFLQRIMRTDARSALLAATPGHLSFVIALGEDLRLATDKMAVVQSIRLLSLTLLVPFAFKLSGVETGVGIGPTQGTEMSLLQTATCAVCAVAIVPIIKVTKLSAPVLMAGMVVGAVARLTEFAPGGLSQWIAFPALAAIGALIGTRFAGISITQLRESAVAGLVSTALAATLTLVAAWAATGIVQMPLTHVFVAFAPGGLETMAIMGAAIGANPGFVAAAHAGRLLLLSVVIPILISRMQNF